MSSLVKNIICVEDDMDFSFFMKRAFNSLYDSANVTFFDVGSKALSFIDGIKYSQEKPQLIFLDLNLPDIDGTEILKSLKQSNVTLDIPVVMLSSSDREIDIKKSYQLGANCYLTKSGSISAIKSTLNGACNFFISNLPEAC